MSLGHPELSAEVPSETNPSYERLSMNDELSTGPRRLVHDEHGSYRILGNTLVSNTYRGSAEYVTELIVEMRESGEGRKKFRDRTVNN